MNLSALHLNLNHLAGVSSDSEPARPSFTELSSDHWSFSIDNSTMEKTLACPKSAEYYVMRRREPRSAPALAFGGAIHAALETLYRNGFEPASLERAKEAFMTSVTERPIVGCNWRTAEYGLTVIERYFNAYQNDPLNVSIYKNPAPFIERSFSIELGTIDINAPLPNYTRGQLLGPDCPDPDGTPFVGKLTIHYTGKMDLAVTTNNQTYVLDHKTTSVMGDGFWDQFEMSPQMIGYCWSFEKITGVLPVGAIINCLALRPPTPTGKPIRFERQRFFYTKEKIDEWHQDTLALAADFIGHAVRGYFPRARLWCVNKYGRCRYYSVCASPAKFRDHELNSPTFSNVTWDPTA